MQRDKIQTHSLIPETEITALLPSSKSHFLLRSQDAVTSGVLIAFAPVSFSVVPLLNQLGISSRLDHWQLPESQACVTMWARLWALSVVRSSRQRTHLCCQSASCSLADDLSHLQFRSQLFGEVFPDHTTWKCLFPQKPSCFISSTAWTLTRQCLFAPSCIVLSLSPRLETPGGQGPYLSCPICTFSTWISDWHIIKCTQVFVEEIHEWTHWNVFEMLYSNSEYRCCAGHCSKCQEYSAEHCKANHLKKIMDSGYVFKLSAARPFS